MNNDAGREQWRNETYFCLLATRSQEDTTLLSAALEDDEAIGEPLKDADGSKEALRMKDKIR